MNAIAEARGRVNIHTPTTNRTGPPFNTIFFNILSPQDTFVRSTLPAFSFVDTSVYALVCIIMSELSTNMNAIAEVWGELLFIPNN